MNGYRVRKILCSVQGANVIWHGKRKNDRSANIRFILGACHLAFYNGGAVNGQKKLDEFYDGKDSFERAVEPDEKQIERRAAVDRERGKRAAVASKKRRALDDNLKKG